MSTGRLTRLMMNNLGLINAAGIHLHLIHVLEANLDNDHYKIHHYYTPTAVLWVQTQSYVNLKVSLTRSQKLYSLRHDSDCWPHFTVYHIPHIW